MGIYLVVRFSISRITRSSLQPRRDGNSEQSLLKLPSRTLHVLRHQPLVQSVFWSVARDDYSTLVRDFVGYRRCHGAHIHAGPLHAMNRIGEVVHNVLCAANFEGSLRIIPDHLPAFYIHPGDKLNDIKDACWFCLLGPACFFAVWRDEAHLHAQRRRTTEHQFHH